ncbi:unnamed protein product, partial [marine sediment metagenome]
PEHKRGFDITFPMYFSPKFFGGYAGFEFELKSMKLIWYAQPYLKKQTLSRFTCIICLIFGTVFDFFAKLSPNLCSRVWCYLVGGFEGIEFHFIKPEKDK